MSAPAIPFSEYIEQVALILLGKPNMDASKPGKELRFGTRGSLSVDLDKGVWCDHESNQGGGVLDLIARETDLATSADQLAWLERQGIHQPAIENKPRRKMVAAYDYVSADDELLFQVCRFEPKDFRQRKPDGNGWNWSVKGVHQVPYRLPQMIKAAAATVYIVEGEKDADKLASMGLVATCNAGGANKWNDALIPFFKGRNVVILPDNDKPGRDHAALVSGKLNRVTESVRVVDLAQHWPDMPAKADVSDWLDAGNSVAQLETLAQLSNTTAVAVAAQPANDNAIAVREPVLDPSSLSEDMLAQVFEYRHADQLRYCHTAGAWYAWTGTRWQQEKTQRAFNFAREICRDFGFSQAKFSRAATAGAVERFSQAARCFAVTAEIWDKAPWLIGTPGGTVDLLTGELRASVQDEHITRQAATAPAPTGTTPKRWLAFLEDATRGDAELIRFLQQVAGYSLTGDTSEHALFFIYGAGGNGKSVFLNTLTGILGEYAQTAAMDTFAASKHDKHPTDLAMLKGARLVSASETEDGRAWAEAKIKQMTGGDPITARFMRRDFFTYRPEFKLVIVGNHKPRLNNIDDATKRRFNIIPFIHKPTVPNPNLERVLRAEWSAILRWMIDGCLDWQKNGLQRPAVVIEATREYFEDQDVFSQWFDESCEHDAGHREANTALFTSWKRYAEAAGESAGTAKSFGEAMRKRGLEPYRTKSERGFLGLRLIQKSVDNDPRYPGAWD